MTNGNGNKNNGKPDYHLMGVILWLVAGFIAAGILGAGYVLVRAFLQGVTQ